MIKYSDETFKFDYKGTVYELQYPTHLQHRKYEDEVTNLLTGVSKENVFDIQKRFLINLGMDESLCESMQQKALNDITMYLTGQKKTTR